MCVTYCNVAEESCSHMRALCSAIEHYLKLAKHSCSANAGIVGMLTLGCQCDVVSMRVMYTSSILDEVMK